MKIFISNIHFAAKEDRTSGPPPPTPKCTLLETTISERIVVLFVNNMATVIP
jgi:hypothetical protein